MRLPSPDKIGMLRVQNRLLGKLKIGDTFICIRKCQAERIPDFVGTLCINVGSKIKITKIYMPRRIFYAEFEIKHYRGYMHLQQLRDSFEEIK